jgi:hypothetical protein
MRSRFHAATRIAMAILILVITADPGAAGQRWT